MKYYSLIILLLSICSSIGIQIPIELGEVSLPDEHILSLIKDIEDDKGTDAELVWVKHHTRRRKRSHSDDYVDQHMVRIVRDTGDEVLTQEIEPTNLLSPNFRVTVSDKNGDHDATNEDNRNCLFVGKVEDDSNSMMAVSNCSEGCMTGLVMTENDNMALHCIPEPSRKRRSLDNSVQHLLVRLPRDVVDTDLDYEVDPVVERIELEEIGGEDEFDNNIEVDEDEGARRKRMTLGDLNKKRRRKRENPHYTVEMGVTVDKDLMNHVRERFAIPETDCKQIEEKMLEIILTLVNVVHMLYRHPSLQKFFTIEITEVILLEEMPEAMRDSTDVITEYLMDFCTWDQEEKKRRATEWDFGILLSGKDLRFNDNKSPSGLAWLNSMCFPSKSCGIGEGTRFATGIVIAHEMGHNLGMRHDGTDHTECDQNTNIMGPVVKPGVTAWSECSVADLKNFLEVLMKNPVLEDCLSDEAIVKYEHSSSGLPGKKFDADTQCMYLYGQGWKSHQDTTNARHPEFGNMCKQLWCRKEMKLPFGTRYQYMSPQSSALPGTTCGTGKVCKQAKCVDDKPDVPDVEMRMLPPATTTEAAEISAICAAKKVKYAKVACWLKKMIMTVHKCPVEECPVPGK